MKPKLSEKQRAVLNFLKKEIKKHGYPPTIREICTAVGLKSTSTVHAHLETLEKKGYIRRSPTKNRSTEILEKDFYSIREIVSVPVIATSVPDGLSVKELFATENIQDTFLLSNREVSGKLFMAAAQYNIPERNIALGDLVVFQRQDSAEAGDVAAVLVESEIQLWILHEPREVLGKAVGLYRRL